jgi:SAM-dependent methyltransferase
VSELVDTAARFLGRAGDYAKYRPSYPPAAIDAIFEGFEDPLALTISDIGAGTGISTRLLAERGARVIAIEPNPQMRAVVGGTGIETHEGTAERTGLPDASVDIVTAFQAFHWFATPEAVNEFVRILKSRGRVALVWNIRDVRDPLTREYGRIADLESEAARRAGQTSDDPDLASLLNSGDLKYVRWSDFEYAQQLDLEALLGRARSASYVPSEGPLHDEIMHGLRDLHRTFADADGTVALRYRTRVHLAERSR